jgi:hypothetical protein
MVPQVQPVLETLPLFGLNSRHFSSKQRIILATALQVVVTWLLDGNVALHDGILRRENYHELG